MGFIYVVTAPCLVTPGGGKWKVGFTTQKIFKRLDALAIALPNIYLCFCYETSQPDVDEARIHNHLEFRGFKREIKEATGNKSEWFYSESVDLLLRAIFELLYPPRTVYEKVVEVKTVEVVKEVIVEKVVEVEKKIEVEHSLSECAARLHSHFSTPLEVPDKVAHPVDPLESEEGVVLDIPDESRWKWNRQQRIDACYPGWIWDPEIGYHMPLTLDELKTIIESARNTNTYIDISSSVANARKTGKWSVPLIDLSQKSAEYLSMYTIWSLRLFYKYTGFNKWLNIVCRDVEKLIRDATFNYKYPLGFSVAVASQRHRNYCQGANCICQM